MLSPILKITSYSKFPTSNCFSYILIPTILMIWMEQYTDKRLRELQQDVIRNRWHTIELEVGCDFPIIRCPLVSKGG